MAEVQTSTHSGEMNQRFIEFVLLHSQNAALFLGLIPHPETGKPVLHLEMARLLIDQLEMMREKTRGNLNTEESQVLASTLTRLQMAYVQVTQAKPDEPAITTGEPAIATGEPVAAPSEEPAAEPAAEADDKKKFVKNYGS